MLTEKWERADSIRRFIAATQNSPKQLNAERTSEDDKRWLEWANWYADQLDPLTWEELDLWPPEDWAYDPKNLRSTVQSMRIQLDRTLELSGQRLGRIW